MSVRARREPTSPLRGESAAFVVADRSRARPQRRPWPPFRRHRAARKPTSLYQPAATAAQGDDALQAQRVGCDGGQAAFGAVEVGVGGEQVHPPPDQFPDHPLARPRLDERSQRREQQRMMSQDSVVPARDGFGEHRLGELERDEHARHRRPPVADQQAAVVPRLGQRSRRQLLQHRFQVGYQHAVHRSPRAALRASTRLPARPCPRRRASPPAGPLSPGRASLTLNPTLACRYARCR